MFVEMSPQLSEKFSVALVDDAVIRQYTDALDRVSGRASRVSSLIKSSGITEALHVISPRSASWAEVSAFHSSAYLDLLQRLDASDDPEQLEEECEEFGLNYDCPLRMHLGQTCLALAGASISAAEALMTGDFEVVINWNGGWHHAQRDLAEGFCYVNDIALCITTLRKMYDKVLYVDLDVHHGNGVENAFAFSPKVFTFSIHLSYAGFYPGTGDITDKGLGKGKYYTLNVPLQEGATDADYKAVFRSAFPGIVETFCPDAIVCQCGADALSGDPLGGFNLTQDSYLQCVLDILATNKPTIFLGGGGYVNANAAKLWTQLTAACCNRTQEIPDDIPDSDEYFLEYGPSFEFKIMPGQRKNKNTAADIRKSQELIRDHLLVLKSLQL